MRVILTVKVVPGASRDRVAGRYGEGVKVQVSAAAEKGKANVRVVEVLAEWLGVAERQIELVGGHVSPHKRFQLTGIDPTQLAEKMQHL